MRVARLSIVRNVLVLGRVVVSALAAKSGAPAVVGDDRVLDRRLVVKPRKEFRTAPDLPRIVPLAVGPDDFRPVAHDKFLELRKVDLLDEFADVVLVAERMPPFEKRIVEAHVEPRRAHGLRQFAAEVPLRPGHPRVEVRRIRGRPEGESVMVLRREHHVLSARAAEESGPCGGVEVHRREVRREISVGLAGMVLCMVRGERGILLFPTLWVGVVFGVALVDAVRVVRRERRNGIHAPVYEYAELGVLPPLRTRPRIQRIPIRLVLGVREDEQRHNCQSQ